MEWRECAHISNSIPYGLTLTRQAYDLNAWTDQPAFFPPVFLQGKFCPSPFSFLSNFILSSFSCSKAGCKKLILSSLKFDMFLLLHCLLVVPGRKSLFFPESDLDRFGSLFKDTCSVDKTFWKGSKDEILNCPFMFPCFTDRFHSLPCICICFTSIFANCMPFC